MLESSHAQDGDLSCQRYYDGHGNMTREEYYNNASDPGTPYRVLDYENQYDGEGSLVYMDWVGVFGDVDRDGQDDFVYVDDSTGQADIITMQSSMYQGVGEMSFVRYCLDASGNKVELERVTAASNGAEPISAILRPLEGDGLYCW